MMFLILRFHYIQHASGPAQLCVEGISVLHLLQAVLQQQQHLGFAALELVDGSIVQPIRQLWFIGIERFIGIAAGIAVILQLPPGSGTIGNDLDLFQGHPCHSMYLGKAAEKGVLQIVLPIRPALHLLPLRHRSRLETGADVFIDELVDLLRVSVIEIKGKSLPGMSQGQREIGAKDVLPGIVEQEESGFALQKLGTLVQPGQLHILRLIDEQEVVSSTTQKMSCRRLLMKAKSLATDLGWAFACARFTAFTHFSASSSYLSSVVAELSLDLHLNPLFGIGIGYYLRSLKDKG